MKSHRKIDHTTLPRAHNLVLVRQKGKQMPTKSYNPEALFARIQILKASSKGASNDAWGVRWDEPGLPVGHVFPRTRVYLNEMGDEIPNGKLMPGASVIAENDLCRVMKAPLQNANVCGTPYIVKGKFAGVSAYNDESYISRCRIVERIDDCPSTRGVRLKYKDACRDGEWYIALHEAGHAYAARWYGIEVREVLILGEVGAADDLGGVCRTAGGLSQWEKAVFSAAGLQAHFAVVSMNGRERYLGRCGAEEDYAYIERLRPNNRNAIEWRRAADTEAKRIVTDGKKAIIALARALMSGRDYQGYCRLTGRQVERILIRADPRLSAVDEQPKCDGMGQGTPQEGAL